MQAIPPLPVLHTQLRHAAIAALLVLVAHHILGRPPIPQGFLCLLQRQASRIPIATLYRQILVVLKRDSTLLSRLGRPHWACQPLAMKRWHIIDRN